MKSKAKYLLITFNVFILSLFSILFISFVVSRLLGINKTWITFSSFPSNLFWIPSLILFFRLWLYRAYGKMLLNKSLY